MAEAEDDLAAAFPEADGGQPAGEPAAVDTPRPEAEATESPRLGILHLLVLTACVAVFLGAYRSLLLLLRDLDTGQSFETARLMAGSVYGILGGAALSGLVLMAARRIRRMPFPRHPGEYLWVLLAWFTLADFIGFCCRVWLVTSARLSPFTSWLTGVTIAAFLPKAVVFIWATVKVKPWRWRLLLVAMPVFGVVAMLAQYILRLPVGMGFSAAVLVGRGPILFLAVAVLYDHLQKKRYPWEHWTGVGLRLLQDIYAVGIAVWWIVTQAGNL